MRPYWHVDLKWIFGILFSLCLFASLLSFSLAKLTAEDVAVPVATYAVASQFSRDGIDDPKDIEAFKKQNARSKAEVFRPIPGQDVTVTRQELYSLSPRELRLKIFRQVVEPIYRQPRTEESDKKLGVFAFLNYETRDFFKRVFNISLIPLLLMAAGLIIFSSGFGRLVSPALPLVFVSAPLAFLLFALRNSSGGGLGSLPREPALMMISALSPVVNAVFFTGLSLVALAILGKLAVKIKQLAGRANG